MSIILDLPNEDAMFEALHDSWILFKTYPRVSPIVDGQEFPALLKRAGVMP
jgi:hypothetical protein